MMESMEAHEAAKDQQLFCYVELNARCFVRGLLQY